MGSFCNVIRRQPVLGICSGRDDRLLFTYIYSSGPLNDLPKFGGYHINAMAATTYRCTE